MPDRSTTREEPIAPSLEDVFVALTASANESRGEEQEAAHV